MTIRDHHRSLLSMRVAVPNPDPIPPPGFTEPVSTLLGWGNWLVIAAGVAGCLAAAIMLIIGRRNRSAAAMDALISLPWIAAGLGLASAATLIVGTFVR